ncbi:MAG: phage integrase SAM-like domain-containing protein [Sphingobacteriaceae bacterium]
METTLNELCDYHNTELKDKLAVGTLKNYYTTQKYLSKFLKEKYHGNDISLAEQNYKFTIDFENFLSKNQPKNHQNHYIIMAL